MEYTATLTAYTYIHDNKSNNNSKINSIRSNSNNYINGNNSDNSKKETGNIKKTGSLTTATTAPENTYSGMYSSNQSPDGSSIKPVIRKMRWIIFKLSLFMTPARASELWGEERKNARNIS